MQFRVCAIDGPGGAGKSTLAGQMAKDLGATVIPMDHFLLPPEKHRLSVTAKNYDLDRLDHEVIGALIAGGPIKYRIPAESGELGGWVNVPLDKPIIIEGIYSMELKFREVYDFSIYIDAYKQTLLRRATDLNGSTGSWLDKWLVGEETYLEALSPISAATLILDGAKPLPTTSQVLELVQLRLAQETR